MSDNVNKLMQLEQKIIKLINDENLTDDSIDNKLYETHYIDKCLNIIKKMSNHDLLESIKRFDYLNEFIDYKVFLKKYKLNKKALKSDPKLCLEEYDKLNNICKVIGENTKSEREFLEYMSILDVDHAFNFLLTEMPNDDLGILANRTGDWIEKLYYYSFLKKEKMS